MDVNPVCLLNSYYNSMFPSEAPRLQTRLEWWFIQGYFQSADSPRTYFMTTFFRLLPEDRSLTAGHSLVTTLVTPNQDEHQYYEWVDHAALDIFFADSNVQRCDLNSHMVNSYLNEIEAYGPPEPISTRANSPQLAQEGLKIVWEDWLLEQDETSLQLQCPLPEGSNCSLKMTPTRPLCEYGGFDDEGTGMVCRTYPRLRLEGVVDGKHVDGSAWFDHQWGDHGYFFADDQKQGAVLGWDWLGITLDNDIDLIMLIRRSMKSKAIVQQSIKLVHQDGTFETVKDFDTMPLRHWKSPHTHVHYPVTQQLTVPSYGIDVTITPLADDQEFIFSGIIRSVWEGAAHVEGTFEGKPVTGTGRMEFQGYGYVFETKQYLENFIPSIDHHIADFFPEQLDTSWLTKRVGPEYFQHDSQSLTKALATPSWDLMHRKGKHWRPICAMLMLETLGIQSAPYEQLFAAVTELNHTGSLIVDDIEDDSKLRRGDECIHLRYGIDTAINAGNTLYFLPYLLLKDHPQFTDAMRLESYELMVQMLTRAHIGQGLDIHWSKHLNRKELDTLLSSGFSEKILQMYSYKTGAQMEGVAEMVCVISRADNKTREIYAHLGRTLGIAYQIIDDIHNFNDSPGWTKVCGEDISAGQPTYVIVTAIEQLPAAQRERLLNIFSSATLRNDPSTLEEAVDLIRNSGALQCCHKKAEEMIESSWTEFAKIARHNDSKMMLRMLLSSLLNYSYG